MNSGKLLSNMFVYCYPTQSFRVIWPVFFLFVSEGESVGKSFYGGGSFLLLMLHLTCIIVYVSEVLSVSLATPSCSAIFSLNLVFLHTRGYKP